MPNPHFALYLSWCYQIPYLQLTLERVSTKRIIRFASGLVAHLPTESMLHRDSCIHHFLSLLQVCNKVLPEKFQLLFISPIRLKIYILTVAYGQPPCSTHTHT